MVSILTAAAAFAVLMIVFSTAITGITESYLRITSVRANALAYSVKQFLENDPTIQRFVKQSVEPFAETWVDTVGKKIGVGKLILSVDRDAFLALFQIRGAEHLARAEKLARDAKDKADIARQAVTEAHALNKSVKEIETLEAHAKAAEAEAERLEKSRAVLEDKMALTGEGHTATDGGSNGQSPDQKTAEKKADGSPAVERVRARITEKTFDTLTVNHSVGEALTFVHRLARVFRAIYPVRSKNFKRVESLSTYSFLQRLAQTDVGHEIARQGDEMALRTLTMGFERYVAASNEVFRKHARAVTMVLSIFFAFVFNVDAVRLFIHLKDNSDISEDIIESGEEVAQRNREAQASLDAILKTLEPSDDGAAGEGAELTDEDKAAAREAFQDAMATYEKVSADIDAKAREWQLPIGWIYMPPDAGACLLPAREEESDQLGAQHAGEAGSFAAFWDTVKGYLWSPVEYILNIHTRCAGNYLAFLKWLGSVTLAGFLIGLGGPFWYRVFSSLSHVLQILRTFQGKTRTEVIEEKKDDDQPGSQKLVAAVLAKDDAKPNELMELFRASTGIPPSEFTPLPLPKQ